MAVPQKITVFLVAGLPRGLREVKIDQWSGKAICGPRNSLSEIVQLPEVESGACIYFLTGLPDNGGLVNIYVGEADGFKYRIRDHDNKKDWWQDVVVFVGRELTKTGVQYLESICVERLKGAGKCTLQNGNNPARPTVQREDVSGLETFYENIATIMPLLGYDIFVTETTAKKEPPLEKVQLFYCRRGSHIVATAQLLKDGKMRVLKGSTAALEETESFQTHPYKKLRDELLEMGRLTKKGDVLIFVDDYVFDSSSAGAAIVQGRSAAGPNEWKTDAGVSLKDILNLQLR